MSAWRFDWRYTAAGLGWGLAVGVLTGATLAVIGVLWEGVGGYGAMFVVLAPFVGAVYGVLPGSLVGLATGLATSVTVGGSGDRRRAWWTAFLTTLILGLTVSVGVSSLLDYSLIPTPYMVVLGVPVLLGAYLMARTSRSVITAAEQRADHKAAPVST